MAGETTFGSEERHPWKTGAWGHAGGLEHRRLHTCHAEVTRLL